MWEISVQSKRPKYSHNKLVKSLQNSQMVKLNTFILSFWMRVLGWLKCTVFDFSFYLILHLFKKSELQCSRKLIAQCRWAAQIAHQGQLAHHVGKRQAALPVTPGNIPGLVPGSEAARQWWDSPPRSYSYIQDNFSIDKTFSDFTSVALQVDQPADLAAAAACRRWQEEEASCRCRQYSNF